MAAARQVGDRDGTCNCRFNAWRKGMGDDARCVCAYRMMICQNGCSE